MITIGAYTVELHCVAETAQTLLVSDFIETTGNVSTTTSSFFIAQI